MWIIDVSGFEADAEHARNPHFAARRSIVDGKSDVPARLSLVSRSPMSNRRNLARLVPGLILAGFVTACDSSSPNDTPPQVLGAPPERSDSVLTGGGLFTSGKPTQQASLGVGVNAFLWRASLDTVSFMPISSADPFGGVIITDWYAPPETPTERFKVNLFILDKELRAVAVKASLFRQIQANDGHWVDAQIDPKAASDLENTILIRARQLRISSGSLTEQ
jgi:hypothetical protein